MPDLLAIALNNVGKCYRIYKKPRDRLKQAIISQWRVLTRQPDTIKLYHDFWALKNISIELHKGETIGIVGRNGAGKSTLLQIISGVLTPTIGSVQINGRVAALLELGAGFNPEFTGRENAYMNASIMGLNKAQIDDRIQLIIEFADLGEHFDQPVKTYSSGMYVRLAFSVIAHVDADILIVDEALAVGDAIFTQKCMRFIRNFQKSGSLIFVSHDMNSVLNLCKKCLWLEDGEARIYGDSKAVVEKYLKYTLQKSYGDTTVLHDLDGLEADQLSVEHDNGSPENQVFEYQSHYALKDNISTAKGWKTGVAEVLNVKITNLTNKETDIFLGGEKVNVVVRVKANQSLEKPIIGFLVRDRLGQDLFGENTLCIGNENMLKVAAGKIFSAEFQFVLPMLPNGQYAVMASVAIGDLHDNTQLHYLHDAAILNVSSSTVRWGLVGVKFNAIKMFVNENEH